jgi:hypothetical protein
MQRLTPSPGIKSDRSPSSLNDLMTMQQRNKLPVARGGPHYHHLAPPTTHTQHTGSLSLELVVGVDLGLLGAHTHMALVDAQRTGPARGSQCAAQHVLGAIVFSVAVPSISSLVHPSSTPCMTQYGYRPPKLSYESKAVRFYLQGRKVRAVAFLHTCTTHARTHLGGRGYLNT